MKLSSILKGSVALIAINCCAVMGAHAADLIIEPSSIEKDVIAAPPAVTISLEALALWRWSDDDVVLGYNQTIDDLYTLDDTVDDSVGAGARLGIEFGIGDGWGFGLSGFYAGSSQSGEIGSGTENLSTAYTANYDSDNLEFANSEDAFNMLVDRDWSLAGVDASASYALSDDFKVTFGPSWLRYANSLHTTVYDEENTPYYIDDVNIESTNDLFGAKVGLEGMFAVTDAISFGGRVAVGAYYASQTLDRSYESLGGYDSPFGTNYVDDSATADGFATSVEVSPKVALAVTDNVSLSLGGTFLWINGIDEATEHFGHLASDSSGLAADTPNSTGVSFGGVTLGLAGKF